MSSSALSPASWLRGSRRPTWLSDPKVLRTEVLGGLVVALALIPEAISFSIIAGVDPAIGLFASFTMAVTIAVVGGRPAMISAATGAVALVIAPLNREHGFGYLVAAVILAGVFQIVLGALGVARLMRFVPRSVMVGFVDSLAILVFMAQIPEMTDVPWAVYPLIAAGLALMVFSRRSPRWSRRRWCPSSSSPSSRSPPASPYRRWATRATCRPRSPCPACRTCRSPWTPSPPSPRTRSPWRSFGLMESLMTAKLVDEITDTHSSKTRESVGQGVANIVTGFFGGMGGCAMIGQTMINVRVSGARTRLSTFLAGAFLMVLCIVFGPVVSDIPMAVLVAVMIMVSVATFDWHSIAPKTLRRMPAGEITVMAVTVACVVATGNLAVGVVVGSITAMVIFAKRVAHFAEVTAVTDPDGGTVVYRVTGELFFASSNDLVGQFDYAGDPGKVVIDLSAAHIWDASSVAALDAIETKYAQRGKTVEIIGLNEPSARIHQTLSGELAGGQ